MWENEKHPIYINEIYQNELDQVLVQSCRNEVLMI